MADSWVEKIIQLKANTVTEITTDFGKLVNTVIVKNLTAYPVFGSLKQILTTTEYEIQVQPGDYGIIVRPYEFQKVYLLATSDITITIYLVWTQNPMILLPNMAKPVQSTNVDVVQTVGLKPGDLNLDGTKDLQVDVKTLPSLPAGTNNIGDVDVISLPSGVIAGMTSLPAGTNNIGDVDVLTLPDVSLAGVIGQKVTAGAAEDVTVKSSSGKVYAIRAGTSPNVTLKDGVTEKWYVPASNRDDFHQPIACNTSIVLNFSAAGDAWILYQ